MSIPNYEDNSQTIAVLTGFVDLMLEASPLAQTVLGKPLDFNDDGGYDDDVIGIAMMVLPPQPDLAISVSTYITNPNAGPGLTEYAIQIRARSDSRDYRPVAFLLDAFREHDQGPRLNGRAYANLSGYVATAITSASIGDMGLNSDEKYELTENYYVIVNDEPDRELPRVYDSQ